LKSYLRSKEISEEEELHLAGKAPIPVPRGFVEIKDMLSKQPFVPAVSWQPLKKIM